MNIRSRLTILFFSIVIVILTVTSFSIYFFSENYRKEDFYRRLKNRATNTTKILTQIKEVNAALLKRMEKANPASLPSQYIQIFNSENAEIYQSDGTAIVKVDKELLDKIREGRELQFKVGDYEALAFELTEKSEDFAIVASAVDVYGHDAIDNLRNILIVTFAISAVLVSGVGWIYAGRVLLPISNIVKEVSNISEMNLNLRLDEGNKKDELSKLAQTFNTMLERLQNAFSSQKSFIANASHEIKTPITVMSGQIEVTLRQEREKAYYVSTLQSILKTLRGLNDLSTRLLLLAHSSAEVSDRKFTPVRIDDVIWEIKDELTATFPNYEIEVIFNSTIDYQSLSVNGDEQLIKVSLLNLIDNGCKYSPDHRVTINLQSGTDGWLRINFVNKATPIPDDDIARIFEPFFRRDANKTQRGFGIGLSLVTSIIKLHGGMIQVTSDTDKTEFSVKLPIERTTVEDEILLN